MEEIDVLDNLKQIERLANQAYHDSRHAFAADNPVRVLAVVEEVLSALRGRIANLEMEIN